ncbi:hypothetical protein A0J61_08576 [Choanephora cucurbitarum]|uniref:Homeobox domain-containing protein n=1 Tax=Choanephora cucurbitarum TaxID=101091 RepID=A0A1C7N2J3_9FUNG|nr:hypothetical protein A0J61_08576 [Choanephora cucurbitarum]
MYPFTARKPRNRKIIRFGYDIYSPLVFPLESLNPTVFQYLNTSSMIRDPDFAFQLERHVVHFDSLGHVHKIQTPFRNTKYVFFDVSSDRFGLPSVINLDEIGNFHAELPTSILSESNYVLEDFDSINSHYSIDEELHQVRSSISYLRDDDPSAKEFSAPSSNQQEVTITNIGAQQNKKRKDADKTQSISTKRSRRRFEKETTNVLMDWFNKSNGVLPSRFEREEMASITGKSFSQGKYIFSKVLAVNY